MDPEIHIKSHRYLFLKVLEHGGLTYPNINSITIDAIKIKRKPKREQ